jgi:N-acetylated-alpha-linked acidic dipeptidase
MILPACVAHPRLRMAAVLLLATPLAASTPAAPQPSRPDTLLGFTPESSRKQREREARFDSHLKADELREWMRKLTARPHAVGSPFGKESADFLAGLFRAWGYETRIEEFQVLLPTPRARVLEMVAPQRWAATLAEPALKEDATSGQQSEQLPTYNAYSIDGDVTGELVYVNYGVPKDYEELERRGIDVKGKIVIARYGGSWRGIKPKVAAEQGAVGCLIYSDPREDGYFQGDVYPKGPYRNERGAQRGSVADMPVHAGDPLTPGVGATKEARRLALKDATTLTKIPVLPISYADARPLLEALGGPVAPEAWRGALPLTYHLGPGPAKVRLKLEFDWKQVPAYDVIATLKGRERPDQWVIRGNHHDAWVNGAEDPVSGVVAVLAEAQALGRLHKDGWTPRRSIVYALWDGEEQGLLGSTEWVETHAAELRQKAVAYVNSDSNGRGFLSAGGSHTLEAMLNEVARDVIDPQRKVSVAERARARRLVDGTTEERAELRTRADLRLAALGSGSDFTPFLQHLGVASLNIGFGGEDGGGSYHSIYDSFDHYTRFGDPSFAYGVALAQTAGRTVLRLAEAEVLPLTFGSLSETIGRYVTEVEKLADEMRSRTDEENRQIRERTLEIATDPRETFVAPKARPGVPYVSFAPLRNALRKLDESAREYDRARAGALAGEAAGAPFTLDQALLGMERALTRAEGLPRRPWFRHHVYAPGFYTGYSVKTLPGVREALEQRQFEDVPRQVEIVAGLLEGYAAEIDRARKLLPAHGTPAE